MLRAFIFVSAINFVFGIPENNAINTDFNFDLADDFTQLAWDSYHQSSADEPGAKNGRDLNWIVKTSLWCGHLTEGYIYKHETATGSDGLEICGIGIQGTDNLSDAVQDIKIDVVEIEDKKTGEHFYVHRGALGRLKCFTDQAEIWKIIDQDCSRDVLYLIGHSLGGAIVQIWTLALLDGFKSVPHPMRSWDIDIDAIDHNVQSYTYSGFKTFSLPFDISRFSITEPIVNGVNWYQDNIPCPESLAGPHLHRIFSATRSSTGQFVVDYIVVTHALALFRFCSQGYEIDLETGLLTKDDLYAPDYGASQINYNIGYHSLTNHIPAMHMPLKVQIQKQCDKTPDTDDWLSPSQFHKKRVRCCSDSKCTSRTDWYVCSGEKTDQEAKQFCADMDMHVCSSQEQMDMCCGENSCWYNNNEVWTSDEIEKTAENSLYDYPTLPTADPECRGHGCEATKYGILYFDDETHPHPNDVPQMPGGTHSIGEDIITNHGATLTEAQVAQKYHQNVLENMVGKSQEVLKQHLDQENAKNNLFASKQTLHLGFAGVISGLLITYYFSRKKNIPANSYLEFAEEEI